MARSETNEAESAPQALQAPQGLDVRAGVARVLGNYDCFARLGAGGMAEVFLGVARGPKGFHKLTVLKRLRDALAEDPNSRSMFIDEARISARLSHPNIVDTYSVSDESKDLFIAMEYLDGKPLNEVLSTAKKSTTFGPALLLRICADALAGLHHAHELCDYDGTPLSIVHRDVSPHNIFVTYKGQIKVVDFGIARAALNETRTETGVLKGKVRYMSPEQAVGQDVDRGTDIFAMGTILWESLLDRRIHSGDQLAVLHGIANKPVPRMSSVNSTIDPELDDLVARATEGLPEDRFRTADEMRLAIEGYLRRHQDDHSHATLAGVVSTMFAEERRQTRALVKHYMGSVREDGDTRSATFPNLASDPGAAASAKGDVGESRSFTRVGGSGSKRNLVLSAGVAVLALSVASVSAWNRWRAAQGGAAAAAASAAPTVTRAPTFAVSLESDPSQAVVSIAGRIMGVTPTTLDLAPGPHRMGFSRPGYADEEMTLQVDGPLVRTVKLTATPASATAPSPPASAPIDKRKSTRPTASPTRPTAALPVPPSPTLPAKPKVKAILDDAP